MNRIDSIRAKIERIESLIAKIKVELETLSKDGETQLKKVHKEEPLPSEKELRAEYERLYKEFTGKNSKVIEEFIKGKSKIYLKAFCEANNLPVVSKDGIIKAVMQWFAQRQAITKRATCE